MKRRHVLTGISLTATTLAGCMGSEKTQNPDENESTSPKNRNSIEYERCPLEIVPLGDLPDPAKEEAKVAIENDVYETDSDLILSDVISIDGSSLMTYDESHIYYKMTVTTSDDITQLQAEEVTPQRARLPLIMNDTKNDMTVDVRIKYGGELLIEETIDLTAGESAALNDREEYGYGQYRARLKIHAGEDVREEEVTWVENHIRMTTSLLVSSEEVTADGPESKPARCEWNNKGELVSGPG